jgi:L-alanine-DL-glutamate epimerase-like enolase superfamily enzyme
MKPLSCEVGLYRIPCRRILENSARRFSEYEFVIVKLSFSNGIDGVGWTYTQGEGGSSIMHLIDDYFAKELISSGISDPDSLYEHVLSKTYSFGLEGLARLAYAALDLAVWDANAKSSGLPLYVMLGGSRDAKVRVYRSAIDLNYTQDELVSECSQYKKEGFTAFKIKVGKPDFNEDLERVAAVKKAIGSSSILMVDANRRWSVKESLGKGRELERLGVYWLEEPIDANLLDGYQYLTKKLDISIAAGESLYNRYEAAALIARRCADIIQLDVLRIGGVTEWMKMAHMAELLGLPVAPHFAEEIAVQTSCAARNAILLEHLPGCNLRDSGVLQNSFNIVNGYASPSDKPGHGIVLDWEKLRNFKMS